MEVKTWCLGRGRRRLQRSTGSLIKMNEYTISVENGIGISKLGISEFKVALTMSSGSARESPSTRHSVLYLSIMASMLQQRMINKCRGENCACTFHHVVVDLIKTSKTTNRQRMNVK